MAGRLYVVSTPIGNLEDITLRALRVLRSVALIAAEDTRRTARLLAHARIETRMTSLHGHNERRASARVLAELAAGHDVALVSDAGTPLLSDPGLGLVQQALDAAVRVEPIPGPSALLAALVMSGMPCGQFTFLGFPPARGRDRRLWLEAFARERRTVVCFEAPHRIRQTLEDVRELVGNCPVAVCREVTKVHEELVRGPIQEVLDSRSLKQPVGEFVLLFDLFCVGHAAVGERPEADDETIAREFGRMTGPASGGAMRTSRRRALGLVARRYGISPREAYAAVERVKQRSRNRHA